MRILAVDTATRSCSVAVADGGGLLAEMTQSRVGTHSRHLMEMIDQVLRMAHLRVADLDGLAVIRGPGSFTGLRIGISTLKGLASASGKDLMGGCSLHVLASQAGPSPRLICPMIDARKKEVYFSLYRRRDDHLFCDAGPKVGSLEDLFGQIDEPCLFIGDGAVAYRQALSDRFGPTAQFAPAPLNTIRAATLCQLCQSGFSAEDLDTFVPLYVRKSDAEIHRESGGTGNGR